MSAKYSEWTYGDNVTYAGNSKLRVDALKATFNDGVNVLGGFKFVLPGYNAATGEYTEATEAWLAQQISRVGSVPVNYAYVPENDNYKVKFGVINLDVKNPSPKTGANSLSVEFGPNALQVYIVRQQVDTNDILVYRLYNSAYQEDGVWYGRRDRLTGSVSFSVNNLPANGYTITSQDLTNGHITLKASTGSDSGTIEIRVLASQPVGFEVANEGEYKKVYYVGERPDFSDILFNIELSEGAPLTNQKVGSASGIRHNLTSAFATPGTQSVTFTFLTTNLEVTLEFEVKAKEDLVVNLVTEVTQATSNVYLPEVTFTIDGKTVTEAEGVQDYGVKVVTTMNGAPVTGIPAEEGTYEITYSFEITNPRFNLHRDVLVTVHVVEAPYIATVILPEKLSTSYTGSEITIPRPTLESLIDVSNGNASLNEGEYRIVWTMKDGSEADWTHTEAGEYEYVLKIMIGDVEAIINGKTSLEYKFVITQAKNPEANVKISAHTVVLGDGADFNFGVTADFGAENADLTYSEDGVTFGKKLPDKAGTWYVKATIAGTSNYAGVEKVVSFEVRQSAVEAGEGSEPGSITGGDGIGDGWTLNISKTEIDDVTINRQTGLYGYNVSLKDASGADVRSEDIIEEYTVRIKLSDEMAAELSGRSDIRVFLYGEDGSAVMKSAEVKDGYVEFTTKEFGRFVITSEIPKAATVPVWLLVLVIVGGVAAAGMIAACVVVFLKKKKGAQ